MKKIKKYYEIRKEKAIDEAKTWQTELSIMFVSYDYLLEKATYFKKLAKRYGLIKEFKENGII